MHAANRLPFRPPKRWTDKAQPLEANMSGVVTIAGTRYVGWTIVRCTALALELEAGVAA